MDALRLAYLLSVLTFTQVFLWTPCSSQFPRVCAQNASTDDAVCCPSMPSNRDGPVCGGNLRGSCEPIADICPSQRTRVARWLRSDDRLDWPTSFFTHSCACKGNFAGYACHRCKPGWWGNNCKIRGVGRIRRNALTMTTDQKDYFRQVLDIAKYEISDWVVMDVSSKHNADPVSFKDNPIQFYDISVYDFLTYLHFYATRSTMLSDDMDKCPLSVHQLDFAHRGSGFLSWNRQFLMEAEIELDEVAHKYTDYPEPFSMPYWDWVDGTNCKVCTNDLVGALDESPNRIRKYLDHGSTFFYWGTICTSSADAKIDDCRTCDPSQIYGYLWREYSNDPRFQKLPTQADVDHVMSLTDLDVPPNNIYSNASSFRNSVEGFIDSRNSAGYYMHNLVRMYMNGSIHDVAGSPNDPLYWLHLSFIDKIFEMWIQKNKATGSSLPVGAPPGHERFDPIVPFFPRVLQHEAVGPSYRYGFKYDNYMLGRKDYSTRDRPWWH